MQRSFSGVHKATTPLETPQTSIFFISFHLKQPWPWEMGLLVFLVEPSQQPTKARLLDSLNSHACSAAFPVHRRHRPEIGRRSLRHGPVNRPWGSASGHPRPNSRRRSPRLASVVLNDLPDDPQSAPITGESKRLIFHSSRLAACTGHLTGCFFA